MNTTAPSTPFIPTGRPRLVDPTTFVFWVSVVATVWSGFFMFSAITNAPAVLVSPAIGWFALVVWAIYGAAFLAIVYRFQLFVRRSPWIVTAALVWGGVTATAFAGKANGASQDLFRQWLGPGADERMYVAFTAATNEETLKVLGVIVLVLLPLVRVRSTLDGWFYGTMVGLGFQVVEDFVFTIQQSDSFGGAFEFLVQRGFYAGLWAHAVYTGIAGAGIGYLATRTDRSMGRRIGVAAGLFLVAWLLHFFWDAPYLEDSLGDTTGGFFLTILIKGVPALAAVIFVVHRARDHERGVWSRFVGQHIDPAIVGADDVTTLLSHKSRKAARHAARQTGGRHAAKVCEELQTAQLRYVQSVSEEGAASASAQSWADRVGQLRSL